MQQNRQGDEAQAVLDRRRGHVSSLGLIIYNFLHSVTLVADACHGYVEYMIKGIEVDRAKVDWYVKNSLMLVTALAPKVGYDKAAQIAHTAHVEHSSLREAALKLGYLTGEEFDQLVKPERMTRPVANLRSVVVLRCSPGKAMLGIYTVDHYVYTVYLHIPDLEVLMPKGATSEVGK